MYSINTTGAATQVGSNGAFTLSGSSFGFDFNPTVNRIRVTSNTDQNLRLNPNDGTVTTTDTALAYAAGDANAGANPNVVGSAYTNNFSPSATTTLFGIDSNLDILVTQVPNNGTLNTVGVLGVSVSDAVGFDISGITGTSFASFVSPNGGGSSLYTINLASGAASVIGSIGTLGATPLNGIAAGVFAPVPEPSATLLMTLGLAGDGGSAPAPPFLNDCWRAPKGCAPGADVPCFSETSAMLHMNSSACSHDVIKTILTVRAKYHWAGAFF